MENVDVRLRRIAVIGGGWAGLAAAVTLVEQGLPVTLFEAGRTLGGRARRIQINGRTVDNGQHILLGAYRDTLALMRQVGADPETLLQRLPLQVADNAGFCLALPKWPAPFNLAAGLLGARGVGIREKFATALWMQGLKWKGFRVDHDITVAAWLDGAGQNGVLRRHLWEPLCLAALNTPPGQASARIFANVLRDSLGSPSRPDTDLLLPHDNLGAVLPDPAATWLGERGAECRLSHRVRTIEPHENRVVIDGESFAAAIVATAPQHAAPLLAQTGDLQFEPIATVYLQYPAASTLPYPLQGLCGGIGQWVVDRGGGLMAAVQSGHGDWEALSDHELAVKLIEEIALPGTPAWQAVIREKRATFSCLPGLKRPAAETGHARLWRAGDYTWAEFPGTLEGAVRSGRRAAHRCAAAINSQTAM